MKGFIVSGTDTGIGKTIASAMLTLALEALYWKPIQSGTEGGTDTGSVRSLTGLPDDRFAAECYVLQRPLSPHRAAELEGVTVDPARLRWPESDRTVIAEGAGGLLVPVTRGLLQINLFAEWKHPIILCARTGLGTINHTLLSLEALRSRSLPVHGLIFIGEENPDNIATIAAFSEIKILGHIPLLNDLTPSALLSVFRTRFRIEDF